MPCHCLPENLSKGLEPSGPCRTIQVLIDAIKPDRVTYNSQADNFARHRRASA
jgi:hypothetical protein